MIKKLLVLWLIAWSPLLYAQTIKTDVLVIGGGPSGIAAAMQSARSKVKTLLVADSILSEYSDEKFKISTDKNIPSGIWDEFDKHLNDLNRPATNKATSLLNKRTVKIILEKMMDTVKNLKVNLNTTFIGLKKDGDYWLVKVSIGAKAAEIKARVIIDASQDIKVVSQAGGKFKLSDISLENKYQNTLYRTGIASGNQWNTVLFVWVNPINNLVPKGITNILLSGDIIPTKDLLFLPVQLQLGQGAGAVAAYCAFFKTDTRNLNVRKIQGELLDFKSYVIPFIDVDQTDGDWRAIQQIGATGLLKGQATATGFYFLPEAPVSTAEIEPVITEIYTRAFLWFHKEKPGEKFTVANTLSLISDYTLTDPALLKATIQKAWKTQYKFKLDFDLNRPISRREFAVLINKYLHPFARRVDLEGRLLN